MIISMIYTRLPDVSMSSHPRTQPPADIMIISVAHNHFPHSLLTRYALGAPPRLLRDIWENDRKHLVSLDPEAEDREATDESKVPEVINRDNWDKPEYLGFDGSVFDQNEGEGSDVDGLNV